MLSTRLLAYVLALVMLNGNGVLEQRANLLSNNIISAKIIREMGKDITILLFPKFSSEQVPTNIQELMIGVSYKEGALPFEDLRYLNLTYIDYNGNINIGEMVVHKEISDKVLDIFRELYIAGYPINKISLIDNYNADDNLSMSDDNSSAFCYRKIAGENKLSYHAFGLAIDINPKINPYIYYGGANTPYVVPIEGTTYEDRTKDVLGMIKKGDICYNAFTSRGFVWGGDWENPVDYQHFEFHFTGE